MGGTLALDSEPGRGTRLTIQLPLPRLQPLPESPAAPLEEGAGPVLRVLVVDDHPANRLLLSQQLRFMGHGVSQAENGQQAFDCFQREHFDVVITDCNMPVLDGYELTRQIRQLEQAGARQPCRIMGFTANAQEEERQRCLAVGMDDCLFKPLSIDTLKTRLGAVSSPAMPPAAKAQEQGELPKLFDMAVINGITGADKTLTRMLLGELYMANELDMQGLDEFLAAGRWADMGSLAHRIKGASRMIGATPLIESIEAYEAALAQALPAEQTQRRAVAMRQAIAQLQLELNDWIGSLPR